MHRPLLTLIILLSASLSSFATHSMGGMVTYRALDTLVYEVTYTFYRDCRGVAFSNPSSSASVRGGSLTRSVSLSLVSIEEVTPHHDTISGGCIPANTFGTGEGVEKHIYRDTIDFNTTPYSALLSSCTLIFQVGQCCRNSAITTGGANQNFYTYATLDICNSSLNTSPSFSFEPRTFLCCNQPVYMNFGFKEPDGDSLSYAFAHPLNNWNSTIPYSGVHYAYNWPWQAYMPGSLNPPYTNPNADPPIGIYLDPETGDLIFVPTSCSEVTIAVIEVTEWRKDSTGTYQEIGVVRSDHQYITKSCPSNNPPEVEGPYSYSVCEEDQLCFNITTDDQIFVPPPPFPRPAADTVRIQWNEGIAGASFSVLSDTARLQTGRFCWTPPKGSARSRPYQFAVQANDNASPLNFQTARSFRITVNKKAEASTTITGLGCGQYALNSTPDSNFAGSPSYRWEVLDTAGQAIFDPNIAALTSTGSFLSVQQQDTLTIQRNGTYIIRHQINNSPQNCPEYYLDTITVSNALESFLNVTDSTICPGEKVRLQASTAGSLTVAYRWLRNADTLSSTRNYIDVAENKAGETVNYQLITYASNGCVSRQDAKISVYLTYFPDLDDTVSTCLSTLSLSVNSPMNAFLWSTGSTDSSITVGANGIYSVEMTDSFGCSSTHEFQAILNVPPTLQLTDRENCGTPVLLDAGAFDAYLWDDSTTSRYRLVAQSGVYHVEVTDSNGCASEDSVEVTIHPLPRVSLTLPNALCCNDTSLDLNSLLSDSSVRSGNWSSSRYPEDLSSGLFDPKEVCAPFTTGTSVVYSVADTVTGCVGIDSVTVQVNPLPRVEVLDSAYCRSEQLVDLGKDLVRLPSNPSIGTFGWSCLDCNGNEQDSIIEDRGKFGVPAYFLWLRDDHYQMKNPDRDTIYLEYSYTDIKGCSNADSIQILVDEVPDTPVITKQGRWLYSSIPDVQWYFEGNPIPGAIGDSLYIDQGGRYRARSTEETSCAQVLSNQISAVVSVPDLTVAGMEVYPNPHDGVFELRTTQVMEIHAIHLYDARGREVPLQWKAQGGTYRIEAKAAAGWYVLVVRTEQGTFRAQLQQR